MYSFNIILTELCNANCTHCYMSNSIKNKKRTMTKEQIDIIIDKMPKNTRTVVFSGGEVLLKKELLYYAIKKTRAKLKNTIIGIESNGIILYKNDKKGYELISNLSNFGVNFIRFSDDPFHEQGGVDLVKTRNLKKYQTDNLEIKFLVQNTAVKLGNAKNIDDKFISKNDCMNKNDSACNPYLFLDVSGNVFTCAWKCVPSVGNLVTDSFDDILSNMNTDFMKLILSGKIEEAYGNTTSNYDFTSKHGQCALCIEKQGGCL